MTTGQPAAPDHGGRRRPTRARPSVASALAAPRRSAPEDLTIRQAQAQVDEWMAERGWTYWHPLAQLARLTEELGEVARLVNHLFGEKPKKLDEADQDLAPELGDLLYTMICLANSQHIDLQEGLQRALEKYRVRDADRYPTRPKPPDAPDRPPDVRI